MQEPEFINLKLLTQIIKDKKKLVNLRKEETPNKFEGIPRKYINNKEEFGNELYYALVTDSKFTNDRRESNNIDTWLKVFTSHPFSIYVLGKILNDYEDPNQKLNIGSDFFYYLKRKEKELEIEYKLRKYLNFVKENKENNEPLNDFLKDEKRSQLKKCIRDDFLYDLIPEYSSKGIIELLINLGIEFNNEEMELYKLFNFNIDYKGKPKLKLVKKVKKLRFNCLQQMCVESFIQKKFELCLQFLQYFFECAEKKKILNENNLKIKTQIDDKIKARRKTGNSFLKICQQSINMLNDFELQLYKKNIEKSSRLVYAAENVYNLYSVKNKIQILIDNNLDNNSSYCIILYYLSRQYWVDLNTRKRAKKILKDFLKPFTPGYFSRVVSHIQNKKQAEKCFREFQSFFDKRKKMVLGFGVDSRDTFETTFWYQMDALDYPNIWKLELILESWQKIKYRFEFPNIQNEATIFKNIKREDLDDRQYTRIYKWKTLGIGFYYLYYYKNIKALTSENEEGRISELDELLKKENLNRKEFNKIVRHIESQTRK